MKMRSEEGREIILEEEWPIIVRYEELETKERQAQQGGPKLTPEERQELGNLYELYDRAITNRLCFLVEPVLSR